MGFDMMVSCGGFQFCSGSDLFKGFRIGTLMSVWSVYINGGSRMICMVDSLYKVMLIYSLVGFY